jgi:hypothetical protein
MIFKRRLKPDRRRRTRQLLNTSVQVFTESAQLEALGINLSDGGMCLFTMANLQVGSQIQVEFLPPRSTELVRVSGIVRHRALYLYGVDFLVDSDQHDHSIHRLSGALASVVNTAWAPLRTSPLGRTSLTADANSSRDTCGNRSPTS